MKKYFWSILFLLTASQIAAQSPSDRNALSKNNLYIYWGWNWSSYTDSNIEFKGNSYDISLKDVTAQDRPSPFDVKTYFHPLQLTKPQYNVRVGYFIKDRLCVVPSRIVIINNGVRMEDQEWGAEHAPNVDVNSISKLTLIKGASILKTTYWLI